MRLRLKVVAYLAILSLGLLYLGLADIHLHHDKLLHAAGFFMFSALVYWVFDLPRRYSIYFTGAVALLASVASEYLQDALSSRAFDSKDIVANLIGSALSIIANAVLHGRVIELRRKSRFVRRFNRIADEENQLGGFEMDGLELDGARQSHAADRVA